MTSYVSPKLQTQNNKAPQSPRSMHSLHTFLVAMHGSYLHPIQLEVSGSSSGIVCHCKLCTAHKSLCHTLFFFLNTRPSCISLFFSFFPTSYQNCATRAHRITAPGQMLAEFLISFSPACQFFEKGESGQKIISRTSHKSECGGSRCG